MAGLINYIRKNFKNYPNTSTPITAENLNHMDKAIYDLDQQCGQINTSLANKQNIAGVYTAQCTSNENGVAIFTFPKGSAYIIEEVQLFGVGSLALGTDYTVGLLRPADGYITINTTSAYYNKLLTMSVTVGA